MEINDSVAKWGLSPILVDNIRHANYKSFNNVDNEENTPLVTNFFPVQEDVIPILIKQNSHRCIEPRDVCVSAPTGSGKTIAFAVPIIHTIAMVRPYGHCRTLTLDGNPGVGDSGVRALALCMGANSRVRELSIQGVGCRYVRTYVAVGGDSETVCGCVSLSPR